MGMVTVKGNGEQCLLLTDGITSNNWNYLLVLEPKTMGKASSLSP